MPNSCRQHPAQAPLPISTAGSSPLESKINPAERHSAYPVPAASPAAAASPADACAGISLPSGAAGADASGRHSVQRDRRLPWLQIFEPQHSLHCTFVCRGCRLPSLLTPCKSNFVCRGCRIPSLSTPCSAPFVCSGCRFPSLCTPCSTSCI